MTIRKICIADTEKILFWKNQPFVVEQFLDKRKLDAETHINWYKNRVLTCEAYQFIITLDNDEEIGSVYLRDVDNINNIAEFGIFIGVESALGKGYGTEAAKLICKYGFENLGLHKIFLRVYADNHRAIKAYEKAGFIKEELSTDDIWDGAKYRCVQFMSIINKSIIVNES